MRILSFALNIGADPRDSEYVRLIKRIWYVSTAFSLPVSLLTALGDESPYLATPAIYFLPMSIFVKCGLGSAPRRSAMATGAGGAHCVCGSQR